MGKTIRRLLLLSAVLGLAGCAEPYPVYYAAPPPLQPYMGPVVAAPTTVVRKRVVRRHHVRRRHRRVHCRCVRVR
ncbi:MAG: hypothetical protein ACM3JG_16635 [Thiohalocapsa sp.]